MASLSLCEITDFHCIEMYKKVMNSDHVDMEIGSEVSSAWVWVTIALFMNQLLPFTVLIHMFGLSTT